MKHLLVLANKNVRNRPLRSAVLVVLLMFLAFTVFAEIMVVSSLQKGFHSLEERLGADIMVVPYEAATKMSLESIILQGNTGYFYMNGDILEEVSDLEGVGRVSAQYYLASASSSCCSIPVEIIGFDPETDFTITPWIKKSNGKDLGYLDVVVGNDLNAFVGDTLSFYGTQVHVAAKLDRTGTKYDTAVFTGKDTIQTLIQASLDKKLNEYAQINAGNVISCVLVDVAEGADVEEVLNDINLHVRKIKAVRTGNMISGISGSLDGISKVAGILGPFVCILSFLVLMAAFLLLANERKKEFAVLRILGASRKELASVVFLEGGILSFLGSVFGTAAGALFVLPFSGMMESMLGLPYLLPDVGNTLLTALFSIGIAVILGALSSAAAAYRIAGADTGTILRAEN
ncbi:MAG: FtsX-like permease family protein [Lachnospiraceae bacterium]|nr:FtsX-like permease family protein [Lachnospiraceae bacterium]